MRVLDQQKALVRVYLPAREPSEDALLDELAARGFAGATMLLGTNLLVARSAFRIARPAEMEHDASAVVELVVDEAELDGLLAAVEALVPEGLVTAEPLRVVQLTRRTPRLEAG